MKGTICCEEKCTACMACANACPKNAIGIGVNKYGYEKVVINDDKCVDCGLCTKVCARRMQIERHSPIKCYAGQSRDAEKLKRSASGAAFQMLAEIVLETGGVCYGCAGEMINGEYNCMMVNTEKGMQYLSKLQEKMVMYEVDLASITRHNSNLLKPSKRGKARDAVLENYYMEGYKKIEENYNDTVGKKRTVYAAKNMIKTHIPDKLRVQIYRMKFLRKLLSGE